MKKRSNLPPRNYNAYLSPAQLPKLQDKKPHKETPTKDVPINHKTKK
jgi:hypothetical protein